MTPFLKRLKNDVFGATAMEYGLILALMFVAMAGALEGFANVNENIWMNVGNAMSNAVAVGTGG
jgi:pilus assembly protein Flp/PilA